MKLLNDYDNYIKERMTEEEADTFTTKILKEHFDDQARKEHWNVILKTKKQVSKQPGKINSTTAKPSKLRLLFGGLAIAASVLFLIFVINPEEQQFTPPAKLLAEEYLKKSFPYNGARKGTNTISEKRLNAGNLYAQKSYEKSIKAYREIINTKDAIPEDFLYVGLNYLYLSQPEEAIQFFKKNTQSAGGSFQKESTWFLSLAYIQTEDFENAQAMLQQILLWEDPQSNRAWETQKINQAKTLLQSFN